MFDSCYWVDIEQVYTYIQWNSCKFEAAQSKNTTMANQQFCGIVHSWALIFLLFTFTSIVEEFSSITSPWIHPNPALFYKRLQISSPNLAFHYHNVIDLWLLVSLSFESCESVPNWVRNVNLKFGWWLLFHSIHACYHVVWWNCCWLLMLDERSLQCHA